MYDIFTEDELNDLYGPIELYGSDKEIIINTRFANDEFEEKLEQYCKDNNCIWDYSDSVIEDSNMEIAYQCDIFGNYPDVVLSDYEDLGKAGFDNGEYDFNMIKDKYTNNSKVALPEWFSKQELENDGFELQSCDFNAGWHEDTNADPVKILKNLNESGKDVVFQVKQANEFNVNFCVWIKGK